MGEQRTKRLTVKLIENLKPRPKPYEIPDGGGLYLTVRPNGSKSFNLRYRFGGKPRNLTLGLSAVGLATRGNWRGRLLSNWPEAMTREPRNKSVTPP